MGTRVELLGLWRPSLASLPEGPRVAELAQALDPAEQPSLLDLVRRLTELRNERAHAMHPWSAAEHAAALEGVEPLARELIARLDLFARWHVLRIEHSTHRGDGTDDVSATHFRGDSAAGVPITFRARWPLTPTEIWLVDSAMDRWLRLDPLVHVTGVRGHLHLSAFRTMKKVGEFEFAGDGDSRTVTRKVQERPREGALALWAPVGVERRRTPEVVSFRPLAPDEAPPMPTSLLEGRYRFDGKLGEGASGVVFAGFDVRVKRRVAIKVIREELCRDGRQRERFRREAEARAWRPSGQSHPRHGDAPRSPPAGTPRPTTRPSPHIARRSPT